MNSNETERDNAIDALLLANDPASGLRADHGRLARIASRAPWSRRKRAPWQGWLTMAVVASVALGFALPVITSGLTGNAPNTAQPGVPQTSQSETQTPETQTPETQTPESPTPQSLPPDWAALGAPDFAEYLTKTFPGGLPFPDGTTRAEFELWLVELFSDQDPSFVEEDYEAGLGFTYEFDVRCLWIQDWVAADAAGDGVRADAAASVVRDSLDWPLLGPNGGGVPEHFERLSDAMSDGDRAGVLLELGGDCDFDVHS